jgi:hypothetical protein
MDGKGRISDSSIHGAIGERGSYPCVWIGGSTPLKGPTWRNMSTLGARLLFYLVERGNYVEDALLDTAMRECKAVVQGVLKATFVPVGRMRTIPPDSWPSIDPAHDALLKRYASIVALGQGSREDMGGDSEFEFPTHFQYRRRLALLAIGHAVLHGRAHVNSGDLELVRWIARSSTPQSRGAVLLELVEGCGTAAEIVQRTKLSLPTVTSALKDLRNQNVVDGATDEEVQRVRPANLWRIREDAWDRV